MNLKTDRTFMMSALTSMLNEGEAIYTPFYGCLMQRGFLSHNYFGFFGRTQNCLVMAILNPFDGKRIDWVNRIPLDIDRVKIHKSLIPYQYVVKIQFAVGKPCKIRMSKKLLCGDFNEQEQNVSGFLEFLALFR